MTVSRRLWQAMGAAGSVLAVLASLFAVADSLPRYWRLLTGSGPPEVSSPIVKRSPTDVPQPLSTSGEATEGQLGAPATPSPIDPRVIALPARTNIRSKRFSSRLVLRGGQQEVLLEGRLGVAVTFAEVAGTPIATLRINREDSKENHALLSAGESYSITVDTTRFRVSVLDLNLDREEAVVQVDELVN